MIDHQDLCVLYYAGELPLAERMAYESHRAGCPACLDLSEALAAGSLAAAAAALPAPARLRVRADIVARASRPARRLAAVAAALAALLAAFVVWSPGRERESLAWRNGVERDVQRVSEELGLLSDAIAQTQTDAEIDDDLRRLERAAEYLARETAGRRML